LALQDRATVRRGQSMAKDSRQAVREFHAAVWQENMALVVFFCSSTYDLEVLGDELRRLFDGVEVVGCTSAGEIGPEGYCEQGITGASLPRSSFFSATRHFGRLQEFDPAAAQACIGDLRHCLAARAPRCNLENTFATFFIDGLSGREEPVTLAFQNALGKVPLVGGSAGDGLNFNCTKVYGDGAFHADSAVLTLVTTALPFKPFMTQHFVAEGRRVVVTAADTEHRIVYEIDGRPAAEAYAELVGTDVRSLDPDRFAASPMVVVIGGTNYVRSISKVMADGSLKFFCAIDEGIVLRVAHGDDLVGNLERAFAGVRQVVGEPQLVIGCDCILRRLEVNQRGLADRVGDCFRRNKVTGFGSYGEQYRGVHVNQTFTGIAIGATAPDRRDA
jgi:hypothetical protein